MQEKKMRNAFQKHLLLKSFLVLSVALSTILLALSIEPSSTPVEAQGTNLLTNSGFDGTWYSAEGVDGQLPTGWNIWANGQKPATDINQFADAGNPPRILSGEASWIMKGGYVAWTAGGYQQATVTEGTTYRFSIYAFVWTCDDLEFSCTDADGRESDKSFGARVKVGVDPTGGTDASASTVLWSTPVEAYDTFRQISVDAVATGSQMTVFTYSTVSIAPALREMYWENAALIALDEGEGNPANSDVETEEEEDAPPPPAVVPFVSPQDAQPDGSVIHTVGEGDTFDSIRVAYRYLGVTREDILELNDWDAPPRIILVGDKIKILPPGSVDPETGALLTAPGSNSGSGADANATATPFSAPSDGEATPGATPFQPPSEDDDDTVEKGGSLLPGDDFPAPSFQLINWL
jgi:hypothetical protein